MNAFFRSIDVKAWWNPRLAAPVALATALRLALLALALARTGTGVIASGDTESYLEPGRNLLLHGRFVTGALPEIDRTPGYPLFLALAKIGRASCRERVLSCV
jgi:hypothetical protein